MNKGVNSYAIYHDLTINADAKSAYDAVTLPEHLNNWWTLQCNGKPVEGTIYNLFFGPDHNWYGKVMQAIPEKAFSIQMTQSDPEWDSTIFGFELQNHASTVRLMFRHEGWLNCSEHFRTSSFCWAMLLNGLKNYLEKGVIVPFEERS